MNDRLSNTEINQKRIEYLKENNLGPYDETIYNNLSQYDIKTYKKDSVNFPPGMITEPWSMGHAILKEKESQLFFMGMYPILPFPMEPSPLFSYLTTGSQKIISSTTIIAFYVALEKSYHESVYIQSRKIIVRNKLESHIKLGTLTESKLQYILDGCSWKKHARENEQFVSNEEQRDNLMKHFHAGTLTIERLQYIWTFIKIDKKVMDVFKSESYEWEDQEEDIIDAYEELKLNWRKETLSGIFEIKEQFNVFEDKRDALIKFMNEQVFKLIQLYERRVLDIMHYTSLTPLKVYTQENFEKINQHADSHSKEENTTDFIKNITISYEFVPLFKVSENILKEVHCEYTLLKRIRDLYLKSQEKEDHSSSTNMGNSYNMKEDEVNRFIEFAYLDLTLFDEEIFRRNLHIAEELVKEYMKTIGSCNGNHPIIPLSITGRSSIKDNNALKDKS